ncbi:hypothetical protein GOB93_14300 [Acetobacter musti]|uniref:Phage protein n=1 Tax=Acetobacter musti TaxID=864732 RepID=A0ABX0JSK0_9PROT|nr:hypothetical protein [Acetobacter musti]NHN85804.1 hypothetical protein [Acetobacter musti]
MGLVGAGVSGGLGMAGSLINGFSQAAASKTEARVDRLNAAQAANNANVAIDQGYLNAQKDYQEGSAKLGAQRAQMAANGVTLDSGSALDVQQATGRNTGMTVGSDLYDANARAVAYRNQATSYDNEARAARANASNAITGGAIGGTLAAGSAFASKWDDLFAGVGTTARGW